MIDLARYLVGEIASVSASTRTFVKEREGVAVTVDDAVESVVDFAGGAVGTIEATRFASGRKNGLQFEINGSKGSLSFDIERLNELQVHYSGSTPGRLSQGFRTVLVSEADHPFWEHWWPQGHMIGWEHTFVHEIHHFLTRDPRRHGHRPARRDVRGRLSRRRDLRRDAAVRRRRLPRDRHLPVLRPIANGKRAPIWRTLPGMTNASEIITDEVTSWAGVTAGTGSRGEWSFKAGAREIGHLHGDRVAHLGFPKAVWQELYDAGRIDYHSAFPGKKGWAARYIDRRG